MHGTAATGAAQGADGSPGVAPRPPSADEEGMRASHVATALAAFLAGSTAATVLHRRARPAPVSSDEPLAPAGTGDAVVLSFARPAVVPAAATTAAAPARCGDSGGRTRTGAPCGARAATGSRCHHHPVAA